jgi:hypothetical protein
MVYSWKKLAGSCTISYNCSYVTVYHSVSRTSFRKICLLFTQFTTKQLVIWRIYIFLWYCGYKLNELFLYMEWYIWQIFSKCISCMKKDWGITVPSNLDKVEVHCVINLIKATSTKSRSTTLPSNLNKVDWVINLITKQPQQCWGWLHNQPDYQASGACVMFDSESLSTLSSVYYQFQVLWCHKFIMKYVIIIIF